MKNVLQINWERVDKLKIKSFIKHDYHFYILYGGGNNINMPKTHTKLFAFFKTKNAFDEYASSYLFHLKHKNIKEIRLTFLGEENNSIEFFWMTTTWETLGYHFVEFNTKQFKKMKPEILNMTIPLFCEYMKGYNHP